MEKAVRLSKVAGAAGFWDAVYQRYPPRQRRPIITQVVRVTSFNSEIMSIGAVYFQSQPIRQHGTVVVADLDRDCVRIKVLGAVPGENCKRTPSLYLDGLEVS